MPEDDLVERVLAYHDRTRHRRSRYAASLGYLDWDSQPDPFRRFVGAPMALLDELDPAHDGGMPTWDQLWGEGPPSAPAGEGALAQLLYDSLALSAWKQAGRSRWSLRVNPSSGNLHPTEGYLIVGPALASVVAGHQPGDGAVLHYAPLLHALERRRVIPAAAWSAIAAAVPPGAFLVALTSIPWREAWKYGERAFRYCQHDAGHAIAGVALAARVLGWRIAPVGGVDDDSLDQLLALVPRDPEEPELPEVLLAVVPSALTPSAIDLDPALLRACAAAPPIGAANRLSDDHHPWPIIDEVAEWTRRVVPSRGSVASPCLPERVSPARDAPARPLIRGRRSAVDMDGRTGLGADAFARMLIATAPMATPWIFGALPGCDIDLIVFVHRVEGWAPGLYLAGRTAAARALRDAIAAGAEVADARALGAGALTLPMWRIAAGDVGPLARLVMCDQDIAADGAFAIAMIAHLEPALRARGPAAYRELHHEAGAIGQVLYLEAEAAGVRATGIGCFFDDEVQQRCLGVTGHRFACLYGFTVGGPIDDPRIQIVPAYHHRDALLGSSR